YTYNTNSFAGKIKVAMLKWTYPKADGILPNSWGTLAALQNYYGIKSKFTVVKNPTEINKIKRLMALPVEEKLPSETFTFLNVATFREEKNQELIIDVVAEMRELVFQVILIGKGPTLEPLKQKVKDLHLEEKIIFINFTENPYKYMSKTDCFLLPSFSEGFPNVLIESMVCGLPIISVDCKVGPRESLAPGTSYDSVIGENDFEVAEYGILTAPNCKTSMVAAMKWALLHPEKLSEFKSKGMIKSNDFEIENVCNEFSEIFDSYLKKN
ncbi:MAG: glycosyltransferase, partial [Ferruginibacter sp.]